MSEEINTHHLRIEFGKHKGKLWTRLPVSYLKWLINEDTQVKHLARAELDRRGVTLGREIEVSGHAIDRASTKLLEKWVATRLDKQEGIHHWLTRLASSALKDGEKVDELTFVYLGIKFVYDYGELYPSLVTVMLAREV